MPRVAKMLGPEQLKKEHRDAVARMAEPGGPSTIRIAVGGVPPGLLLQVMPNGSASWILRRTINGKRRMLGLGAYVTNNPDRAKADETLSLSGARKEASAALAGGQARKGDTSAKTFKDAADALIKKERDGWKNEKHAAQWTSTLVKWVFPLIGDRAVDRIGPEDVEKVLLQPIKGADGTLWANRHETATRVRQRVEKVMAHAKARKWRGGENPAAWRDNLDGLMPKPPKKAKRTKHHAALPYAETPAFMTALRERSGIAAQALQFLILTAARSGEVRHADWSEIDLERALWTIPEDRMKADKEHVVPLSDAALAILTATPENERKGLVFPGAKEGKPLSDMTLAAVLKRMERPDITVHGFRSTFREWAGETTSHPREVIEHALAHQLADKAEASYQRGSLLPKRVRLMADWSGYVNGHSGGNIVPIKGAA